MSTVGRNNSLLLNEHLRVGGDMADLEQEFASNSPETFQSVVCADAVQTGTECSSKIGIAVSLIDAMIAIARVLWLMYLSSREVQDALKDLKDNYELSGLITQETKSPQGRLHDEVWR